MRLNVVAMGLAFAVFWTLGVLGVTIISAATGGGPAGAGGYGEQFVRFLMSIYPGYSISLAGAAAGVVWSFVDGFVSMAVFSWLYNFFACRGTAPAGQPKCRPSQSLHISL